MSLPSSAGGPVTQEVGFFERGAEAVAVWLADGLADGWATRPASWSALGDAVSELAPSVPLSRYALVPIDGGDWSLLLNNGPLGTDVGVLPSHAARELGSRAIRAVCVDDDDPGYPARVLEVYGPDGEAPLLRRRSIVAANDGGTWVFEAMGEPFGFEHLEDYGLRRKAQRLTCARLYEYLEALGVPFDAEPDWGRAVLVERAG